MRELALHCLENNIILQAGHTNATYDQMIEGMQAGIFHSTHMFNAMRAMHHREPGVVGAILTHPEMSCELIADGFHVNSHLFKLLTQCKLISQIVLISDSLKYAKSKIPEDLDLYFDKYFKRKTDDVIMGSGSTVIEGLQNLIRHGFSAEDAVQTVTFNPARIMRQHNKGRLSPGMDADINIFDKNFNLQMSIIKGQMLINNNSH